MTPTGNNFAAINGNPTKAVDSTTDQSSLTRSVRAKTLAITSGKGGVGKSNIATNLAIVLAQKGYKVCIFDADTNLANVNILMGLTPHYSIEHLLNGAKTLEEVMITGPAKVKIIPAASGIADNNELDDEQKSRLISALETLEREFDYLIVDTAAGINNNVTRFLRSVQSILLVISTEPTSLTDAFALLRILKRSGHNKTVHVLVNMAINFGNGIEVFKRFDGAVKKYLKLPLHFIGYITDDIAVKDSVRYQCPVVLYRPDSLASRCFINIEKGLTTYLKNQSNTASFSSFWKETLNIEADNIHLQQVTELSENKESLTNNARERALNYLNATELTPQDNLTIILKLIQKLPELMSSDISIDGETKTRISEAINKLQSIAALESSLELNDQFGAMVDRLTSAGTSLEHQLDELTISLKQLTE